MPIAATRVQANVVETATARESAGHLILRYGLVLVVAWIGAMKFTAYAAVPGQFLLKDVVLLGAAVWSLGEALMNVDLDWRI